MEHKSMFKRILSFVVIFTMLFSSFVILAAPAFAADEVVDSGKYGAGLTIEVSDNDEIVNLSAEEAAKKLTDGDWALDAPAWGGDTSGVVLIKNKNATQANSWGQINLIWNLGDDPEAYNQIRLGLYSSVESMIGYPTEEDVFFSNDGEDWVSGYSTDGIGYGETIPTAYATFEEGATAPGTVIGEIKLRNPQTYKYVKIELYFPESPFTVESGKYTEETAKPVWEFFGLTEIEITSVKTSNVVTDWNPHEYWEGRGGKNGSYAFNNAEDYAASNLVWWKHVSFAPVEGEEGKYTIAGIRNAGENPKLDFPEGGFVWAAWGEAGAGTPGKAALNLFSSMSVGDVYVLTGFDVEGEYVENDATVTKYVDPNAPVNVALGSKYEIVGLAPSPTYPDIDNKELTDGARVNGLYNEPGWVGVLLTGTVREFDVIVPLGDGETVYNIDKIIVNAGAKGATCGVTEPDLKSFYSIDGEEWIEFGSYVATGTDAMSVNATMEVETPVEAKFIKINVSRAKGIGNLMWLGEIEAYGVEAEAEPAFEYPEGYIVVTGETGKWQKDEGDFDFGYKYEVVDDNLVVDVIINDELVKAAADATSGNGVATNVRLWVNYGNAKWDRLYDGYFKGDEIALYSKDAAGTVGTEGTIAFADNVITFTLPLEELAGGNEQFQFTICVSNTDAEGKNNACLYAFCDTFAWSAWDSENTHTIVLPEKPVEPAYKEGLTIEVNSDEVAPLGDITIEGIEAGLTDGNWGAGSASDWSNASGIYCLKNKLCTDASVHPLVNLIYNFGEATEINTIKLGVYSSYDVMIGYPSKYITIYTSEDGVEWNWADIKYLYLDDPAVGNEGSTYAIAKLSESINAQFVKVELEFADSPFTVENGYDNSTPVKTAKPVWEFMGLTEIELSYVEPVDFEWVDKWNEVDEYGVWQSEAEVPENELFDFDYAVEAEGDNVNIGIKYYGSLSGSAESYGNGNGTNFRLWFFDPTTDKAWDALMDVSYNGSEWLTEYRANGEDKPYKYGYAVAEKPINVNIVEMADGVDALIEVPLEVLGFSGDYFQVLVSVSNKEVSNYCLHSNNDTKHAQWHDSIVIGTVYEAGLTIEIDETTTGFITAKTLAEIEAGLIDGNWALEAAPWNSGDTTGVYPMQNNVCKDATQHPEVALIYALEEAKKIGSFKLGVYSSYDVMIGYPANEVAVYTSENGIDWVTAGTADLGLEAPAQGKEGTVVATATLEEAVSAKFFKFVLTFADSPFTVESGNYTEESAKPVWEFMGLTELELVEIGTKENPDSIAILPGMRGYMGEGSALLSGGASYYWNITVPVDGDMNVQFMAMDDEYNNYNVSYSFNGGETYESFNFGNPALEDLKAGDVVTLYCELEEAAPAVDVTAIVTLDAVGSQSNPAVIPEAGEQTTVIDENDFDGGMTYTYTAPADGKVTVTIADTNETGWIFSVSNLDKYVYGDMHYSDDDPVVASETIDVEEGDVLTITIATYGGMSPAGTINWTLAFEEYVPVTSKVVTDFNPAKWAEGYGGATGAYIFTDADIYANVDMLWWIHTAFAPVEGTEGLYEVVAVRAPSENPYLTIPEGGFVWTAWSSAADEPESSGAFALDFMGKLITGDKVLFTGVDIVNKTTTADATAEKWVDPDAPVPVDIKSYTASKTAEWQHWTYDTRDDGIRLIDGVKAGTDVLPSMSGWYFGSAYPDGGTVELVFDLGEAYDVSSVVGYFYHYYPDGYSSVDTITVSYSADGVEYTAIEAEAVKKILNDVAYPTYSLTITPAEEVTASYIKVVMTGLANSLIITDEIEVYGEKAGDVPVDPPVVEEVITVVPNYNFKYAAGNTTILVPWTMGDTLESILDKQYEWFNFAILEWDADAGVYKVADVKIGTDIKASVDPENGVDFGVLEIPEYGFILGAHNDDTANHEAIAKLEAGDIVYIYGTDLTNATLETALTDAVVTTKALDDKTAFAPEIEEPKPVISGWGAGVEVMTDGYTGVGEIKGHEGNKDKIYGFSNNLLVKAEYDFTLTIEEATFDEITLYILDYAIGGSMLPESVKFVVNGETYDTVITPNENGIGTIVAKLDEAVTASEIKVEVVMSESPYTFGIFHMFTEIEVNEVTVAPPVVQPEDKVTLPEGAINLSYAGYKHEGGITIITSTDADTTLGALAVKGDAAGLAGEEGDFNYWSVIIVDAEGKVIYSNATLGRDNEGGIKTDVAVPAGAVVIATHGGSELAKVGQIVKVYNVDLAALATLNGYVALEQAGYTVEDAPVVPEVQLGNVNGDDVIDLYDYILVKREIMNTIDLTAEQLEAADVNGDDVIDLYDYILIKRHIMGTYKIPGADAE